jgi:hypothetical protein
MALALPPLVHKVHFVDAKEYILQLDMRLSRGPCQQLRGII